VRSKDIALGGFYWRMAARRGGLIATMALARKLAAWYWRVMVKGDDYVEKGLANYDAQVLQTTCPQTIGQGARAATRAHRSAGLRRFVPSSSKQPL
jgi:hypothetical protein